MSFVAARLSESLRTAATEHFSGRIVEFPLPSPRPGRLVPAGWARPPIRLRRRRRRCAPSAYPSRVGASRAMGMGPLRCKNPATVRKELWVVAGRQSGAWGDAASGTRAAGAPRRFIFAGGVQTLGVHRHQHRVRLAAVVGGCGHTASAIAPVEYTTSHQTTQKSSFPTHRAAKTAHGKKTLAIERDETALAFGPGTFGIRPENPRNLRIVLSNSTSASMIST